MFFLQISGENSFLSLFSFWKLPTFLGLWPLFYITLYYSFCHYISYHLFCSCCLSHSYKDPCDCTATLIIQDNLPHLKILYSTISAKPLLPCKITDSPIPGIRIQTSLGRYYSAYHKYSSSETIIGTRKVRTLFEEVVQHEGYEDKEEVILGLEEKVISQNQAKGSKFGRMAIRSYCKFPSMYSSHIIKETFSGWLVQPSTSGRGDSKKNKG